MSELQPESGDPCARPTCDGSLYVYDSRIIDGTALRRRYLRCNKCNACPVNNKRVEPDKQLVRRGITRFSNG